ncbi:MAG: hypothetical protein RL457_966 [Pseudomonadota bacterium]
MSIPPVTIQTLQAFSEAWNAHDIDALMSFMAPTAFLKLFQGQMYMEIVLKGRLQFGKPLRRPGKIFLMRNG